jgi:hypothetical protein
MRAAATLLILLASVAAAPRALARRDDGLADARGARAMLGPESSWARVVRVDNSHPRGAWRSAAYPRTVYGLVFELSGILWLYTDGEGTQSLSQTLGTVARDEADPGPLLRAIEPGIGGWAWVPDTELPRVRPAPNPPKACVEESLLALERRVAVGGEALAPRLLFYYVSTPFGRLGHTVLIFRTARGLSAIDPQLSPRPVGVPPDIADNLLSVSEFLRGAPVASARTLPLAPPPGPAPGSWATLPAHGSPAG